MADPDERDQFLRFIHTAAAVAFRVPDGGERGRAAVMRLAAVLSIADFVSRRIPDDLPAMTAALEFMNHTFDQFADERAAPDYRPAEWMGLMSRAEFEAMREGEEELIDGIWRPVNPEWVALPGDSSDYLNLLVRLRSAERASMSDLQPTVPHLGRRSLNRLLHDAVSDGLAELEGAGRGAIWVATRALIAMRNQPAARPIAPPPSKKARKPIREIDPTGEMGDAARAASALGPRRPAGEIEAFAVLNFLRRHKKAKVAEIRAVVPDLDRYRLRRLLNRLAADGYVISTGERRTGVWAATAKLRGTPIG